MSRPPRRTGSTARVIRYTLVPAPGEYRPGSVAEPGVSKRRSDYGEPRPREPSEVIPKLVVLRRLKDRRNRQNRKLRP